MYLGGLIRKEFGRIKSNKRSLALVFIIPFILLMIYGLVTEGSPSKFFTVAVITRDDELCDNYFPNNSSEYDEEFIDIVENNCSSFELHSYFNSTSEQEFSQSFDYYFNSLKTEAIDLFIILPKNFSESLENETDTHLIYYIDGSDLNAVEAIEVAIQEPIGLLKQEIDKTINFTIMFPHHEFEVPDWKSKWFNYTLGIILPLIIIATTMNLTSLSIVLEGPLPRMLLTPIAKREVILSKLIANSIIMILQAFEIFTMTLIFGLHCVGSLLYFLIALILIGFCGISMGLFISSVSKTDQVANQLFIMFFIMIMMFSGGFLDISKMSQEMQIAINLLPMGHAIPLIVAITLKGLPLDIYHSLSLLIIGSVFLLMAYIIYSFKKIEV